MSTGKRTAVSALTFSLGVNGAGAGGAGGARRGVPADAFPLPPLTVASGAGAGAGAGVRGSCATAVTKAADSAAAHSVRAAREVTVIGRLAFIARRLP